MRYAVALGLTMHSSTDSFAASGVCRRVRASSRLVRTGMLVVTAITLGGCATPKGSITYYLPKAETTLKVNQTLTCNAAGNALVQVGTGTPATSYTADIKAPVVISPRSLDGWLSNADVGFNFTNDGRLSSVNVETAGQAGEVAKGVLAVAKVAGVFAAAMAPTRFDAMAACNVIARYSAKAAAEDKKEDKKADAVAAATKAAASAVTIGYETKINYARTNSDQPPLVTIEGGDTSKILVDANSAQLFLALAKHIPSLGFHAQIAKATKYAAPAWSGGDGDINIKLNSVAEVVLEVTGLAGDMSAVDSRAVFWQGALPVPLTSKDNKDLFDVPIPAAAMFGTRKFSLTLTDYGSIGKIQYGASKGVTEGAAAAAAIGSAWATPKSDQTVAQQADALKAEGDLIYQQQRKATCLAKPDACAK